MKTTGKCSKCGSRKFLANISMSPEGTPQRSQMCFAIDKSPDAWIISDYVKSEVRGWVCEDCGFTEFYTLKPESLGRAIDNTKATDKFKQKELPYRMNINLDAD